MHNAVAEDPGQAKALAQSAITTYKNRVIADEVSSSTVAETFWNNQLTAYNTELTAANKALTDYLSANKEPATGERSEADKAQIASLQSEVDRAQTRFDSALNNREQARLNSVVSSADIDQRFRVLDEPTTPSAPESGLRTLLTTVVIFSALGLMLTVVAICLATVLERSILSAADLDRLGAPARAVVPRSKRMRIEPRRVSVVRSEPTVPPPPMASAS